MCTIIVRHRMDDWCSTIVASNRDEFYDRPASGPGVLRSRPLTVGGRDEREGGTWFGLTREGLFVGLTNQRSFGTRDDSLRSRGGLVLDALAEGSLEGALEWLTGGREQRGDRRAPSGTERKHTGHPIGHRKLTPGSGERSQLFERVMDGL